MRRAMNLKPQEGRHSTRLSLLVGSYTMLGPFSISTYMPFFPALIIAMGATQSELQQTLSVYLAAFAFMMLFHGPLSDSFGRRPVILVGLAVYFLSSVGAAATATLTVLLLFRAGQGLAVGSGGIAGRALVRDSLEGPDAQRVLSHVQMVFAISPAVAPVFGGWLHQWFPWQSVFIFMAGFSLILVVTSYFFLPESLPQAQRTPFRPRPLLASYAAVFRSRPFWLLTVALSFNFAGFFVYVSSAPRFVLEYLRLSAAEFGWLFIPAMAGSMLGSYLSARAAAKWSRIQTVGAAYAIMFAAGLLNVVQASLLPATVPWSVLPIMLFTIGMGLAMPTITLATLDLFPHGRGMAGSVQGFLQTIVMTLVSSFAPPAIGDSGVLLAAAMIVFTAISGAGWFVYAGRVAGSAP